jgi:hypothetical protein
VIGRLRTEIFPPDVAERQGRGLRRVLDTGEPLYQAMPPGGLSTSRTNI